MSMIGAASISLKNEWACDSTDTIVKMRTIMRIASDRAGDDENEFRRKNEEREEEEEERERVGIRA